MKKLGVIGGLGPMATAYFLELLVKMTDAARDQEHLNVIILNRPGIPDRTAHILNPALPSPLPQMQETAQALEAAGVAQIAIPCITSHFFYKELSQSTTVPIVHIVNETAAYLAKNGIRKAGIMATSGTITTGLFQKALSECGIAAEIPDESGQAKVMRLIYDNVKAGKPVELPVFFEVAAQLRDVGCESIILGCTELSLIKRDYSIGAGFLDALEVLAKTAVLRCEKPLRPLYNCLLTAETTGRTENFR